jgi:hypothetical protein
LQTSEEYQSQTSMPYISDVGMPGKNWNIAKQEKRPKQTQKTN